MSHIGIDIGTSYSSVCILNENGQPERVKIATGTSVFGDSYSLPSAVFLEEDGRLLLGQAAIASRMRAPQNFKNEFKRDLGQPAPYLLGGNSYLPEDLYKEFFIYIKKCVEDYTHKNVDGATVTFPAMFNENKKKLIESAAKRAGLLEINLLDEPSAAAYCYLNAGKISEGDTLLVYDLGGGTFDLALMRVKDGKFEPLAQPMGNPRLGGADFDRIIFDDIMAQIGEERVGPIKSNPVNYSRFVTMVFELAIKAKHHLSSSSVFSDFISVGYDAVEYMLERNRYNAMIAPLINDTMNRVKEILQSANLKQSDVNKVLLVGGASRTPLVGEMLLRVLGQEPLKDVDPELAVCEGAVVLSVFQKKLEEQRRKEQEEQKQKLEEEQRRLEEWKEEERQRTFEEGNKEVDNKIERPLLSCDAKVVTQASKFALKGQLTVTPNKVSFFVSVDHSAYSGAKEIVIMMNDIIRVEREPFRAETASGAAAMIIPHVAIVKGIAKIPKNKKGIKIIGRYSDFLFGFNDVAYANSFETVLRQYIIDYHHGV